MGEGGVGTDAGLLGDGGEGVALLRVGGRGAGPGGGQPGGGVDDRLGGRRDAERGDEEPAGGGGRDRGGVEVGEPVLDAVFARFCIGK